MSPEAREALRAGACPEAEELAAYIDGTLSPAERAAVNRHLAQCADCREVVGETVAFTPVAVSYELMPAAVPFVRRRPGLILGLGGALLATAAALLVVIRMDSRSSGDMEQLLRAVNTARPVEPRLSVIAGYAPPPPVTRAGRAAVEASPDARIAAARLEQLAAQDASPANLHAAGIGRLLVDDPRGAVELLQRAADAAPAAPVLADLAAALLIDGERQNDPALVGRARAAADRAIELDPSLAGAAFNAALAAERIAGRADAAQAWERYLRLDAGSRWADEARAHLARLRQVPQ